MKTEQPPAAVQVEPPAGRRVLPNELWDATKEALGCFESRGIDTNGPYPVADGSSVQYSFAVTPDSLAVEEICTATVEPLSRQFAFDNAPVKTPRSRPGGEGAAATPGAEVAAPEPATSDAAALASLAQDLETCLVEAEVVAGVAEGAAQDASLQIAAQDEPEAFQGCVAAVE